MSTPQYALQPYQGKTSRFACPSCKKPKEFARYIDTSTGLQIAWNVGRCNREMSCGYHFSPKQYFDSGGTDYTYNEKKLTYAKPHIQPASFIDFNIFKQSTTYLKALESNCFIQFLLSLFSFDITNTLINRFFIGSARKWKGANIFWQIDSRRNVRTGRIMLYNPVTGKRVKEPYNYVSWVHSELQNSGTISEFNLSQCFFGEHQFLFDKQGKPVAIVESEKTAIIASVFLPDYIWLAAGGINGLSIEKCKVLSGKKVLLVPDLKAFDKWQEEAGKIRSAVGCQILVSDLLEKNATDIDREKGLDLADYLVKRDPEYGWALSANNYPLFWD